ncbi:AAA family ATPase [Arthrobacter mobilis]|uniref:26S protease regulatory subunit n=1 Tax=Arthrobacter mobilis TaxID=2724944 RepID=A0A7X6HEY8_9MICC|nr:ATP-binding protein [Arthrobacter mobilis]NKX55841.1 26S protease regulatory subunit [Arthrobacter mobilis]
MEGKLQAFIEDFAALVRLAERQHARAAGGEQLLETLSGHLGIPADELPVVVEEVPGHRFADADILLAEAAEADPEHRLVGIGGGDQRHHLSLSDMLQQSRHYPQFPLSQPDYANVAVGPARQRQAVSLGLRLFRHGPGGEPLAVLIRAANPRYGQNAALLEVLGRDPRHVAAFLAAFRADMQTRSVLKGQVVSLTMDPFGDSGSGVTFHERPRLAAADVVLPEGLLDRISRHAVELGGHREQLRGLGQHLKRGILLYGPPGTGKTHTVRYLLGRSDGTTAIILSGGSLAFIAEAARMARALQPSMIILEDCDLIAGDRSFGHGPQPLLFEVLDAMDGLDDDADVAFVLTTNRVDMLERALAQRPGRVDLAVQVPLPEAGERAALLRLYARELAFSDDAIARAAELTAGTTASFARELVRRAVVASALSGTDPADPHLLDAAEELMSDGEALTRSLLGSAGGVRSEEAGPDPAASSGYFAYAPLSGRTFSGRGTMAGYTGGPELHAEAPESPADPEE